jgi:2-polyprenyl-6-methoxyphenol hydroxylase-like FAD-dependent oxidoreductase
VRVLISGAGIAGPCLAYWLRRQGFEPTIVERAPALRTGGYIIDFWGAGFDVAERMGLVPELLEKGYKVREVRQVDRSGKRVGGFRLNVFDRVTHGRFTSLPRAELAASLYRALEGRVETIFDDSIAAIEDGGGDVRVRFDRTPSRSFDLVIGADGLHSRVRRLAFGNEARFERFLGMKVAAFSVEGYRPRDELVYMLHREVGQQVGRFTMRGNRTMFLFVFADDDGEIPTSADAQKQLLRLRFALSGWECPNILAALGRSDDLYMDRVSQIHMARWSRGRVALVGDAAFCPSLLAGQGSALAMVAAYVLAGELGRAAGDHEVAFARYQARLGALIARKQRAAVKLASFFAPRSRWGIFVGNQITKLMGIPGVTELAVGREIRDSMELPDYQAGASD